MNIRSLSETEGELVCLQDDDDEEVAAAVEEVKPVSESVTADVPAESVGAAETEPEAANDGKDEL